MLVTDNLETLSITAAKSRTVEDLKNGVEANTIELFTLFKRMTVDGSNNENILREMWLLLAGSNVPATKYLGAIKSIEREGNTLIFGGFKLRFHTTGLKLVVELGTEKFVKNFDVDEYYRRQVETGEVPFRLLKDGTQVSIKYSDEDLLIIAGLIEKALSNDMSVQEEAGLAGYANKLRAITKLMGVKTVKKSPFV